MGGVPFHLRAVLLSGGIDSAAVAFWKKPAIAIHLSYGQRAATAELKASRVIAQSLDISFHHIAIDLSSLGSGDLTRAPQLSIAPVSEWWPFRNQALITLAAMKALTLGAKELYFGAVSTDAKHVDGTASFFSQLAKLLVMQEGALQLHVPGVMLTSEELVKQSGVPSSVLGWTYSCHTGEYPCGNCNGCQKHFAVKHHLNLL